MAQLRRIGFVEIASSNPDSPHLAIIEVGNDGFSTELNRAMARGENPAKALLFLAKLAAGHCNPHHTQLIGEDRALWEKYFGLIDEKTPPPKRRVHGRPVLVKK